MVIESKEAIRAKVETALVRGVIETPNVLSFSVRRARKQMSANFSVSIKVRPENLVESTSGNSTIQIFAGKKGSLGLIFTGIVEKCVIQPVRSDAAKIILNMSGRDTFSVMEGQKINRRLKTVGKDMERWGVVTGIKTRNTARQDQFKEKIVDWKAQGIVNLQNMQLDTTPNAFRLRTDVNKELPGSTVGGLEVTGVVEAGGTSEESSP